MDSIVAGRNIDHQLHPYFVDLITFSTLEGKWINGHPGDAADGLAQIIQNVLDLPLVYVALLDPAQDINGVAIRIDHQPVAAAEVQHISLLLEPYLAANPESPSLFAHPRSRDILCFTSVRNEAEGRQAVVAVGSKDLTFPRENDHYILALAAKQGLMFLKQIRLLDRLHQMEGTERSMEERMDEVLIHKPRQSPVIKTPVGEASQKSSRLLAMLESLLVHAPFGFAFFDQDHRYVRINKVLAQMNGLPVEMHYDRTVSEVLPQATAQAVNEAIERVFATGKTVENMEITGETSAAPGQVRHWLTNFYPVMSEDHTSYVGETVIEITEQKEAVEALRESHAILRAIFEGTGDGIYLKDRQSRYLMINAAGASFVGKSIEEMVGKTPSEIMLPDMAEKIVADDQRVMNSRQAQTFEDVITLAGLTSYYHSTKAPYFDAEGNVAGIIGISRDITTQKRTEKFNQLLAKAGEILNSSLDYDTRLENVAQLAVPSLADWCVVSVGGHKEAVQQVAVAHTDPDKVAIVRELQKRYPSDPQSQTGAREVFETGRSVLYPTITDDMIVATARNEDHLRILRTLQITSAMVVPLRARGDTLGVMTFIYAESGRHYTEADVTLAEELGRRAGLAIENARLYSAEREARAEAEAAQENLAMLTQERERNRLAQELHDNVAQAIGYLNLKLAGAGSALRTGHTDEVEAVLSELKQVVNEVYTDVREEIFSLRSQRHADTHFLELLHRYVDKYKRFYRLNIQLEQEVTDEMLDFPAEVRLQVVRTIQEALMNTRKHAQVNEAVIRISHAGEYIQISVEDEGQGFNTAPSDEGKKNSFGLRIMRERMASIGGKLDIFSIVGEGTQTIISVPSVLGLSHGSAHQEPGENKEDKPENGQAGQ